MHTFKRHLMLKKTCENRSLYGVVLPHMRHHVISSMTSPYYTSLDISRRDMRIYSLEQQSDKIGQITPLHIHSKEG